MIAFRFYLIYTQSFNIYGIGVVNKWWNIIPHGKLYTYADIRADIFKLRVGIFTLMHTVII